MQGVGRRSPATGRGDPAGLIGKSNEKEWTRCFFFVSTIHHLERLKLSRGGAPAVQRILISRPSPFCVRCGRGFNAECGRSHPALCHVAGSGFAPRVCISGVFPLRVLRKGRFSIRFFESAVVVPRTHVSGLDRSPSCLAKGIESAPASRGGGMRGDAVSATVRHSSRSFMTRCASLFQRSALSTQQQRASFLVMFLRFLRGVGHGFNGKRTAAGSGGEPLVASVPTNGNWCRVWKRSPTFISVVP